MAKHPPKPKDRPAAPRHKVERKGKFANYGALLDQRRKAFEGLRKDSDRAAGLLAATFVEDSLELCLRRHFRISKKLIEVMEKLFHPSAPLGSFSTKIRLGGLLGLYYDDTLEQLETIKEIRNLFAHNMEAGSFDAPIIKRLSTKLHYPPTFENIIRHIKDADDLTTYTVDLSGVTAFWVRGLERHAGDDQREAFISICLQYVMLLSISMPGANLFVSPYSDGPLFPT